MIYFQFLLKKINGLEKAPITFIVNTRKNLYVKKIYPILKIKIFNSNKKIMI